MKVGVGELMRETGVGFGTSGARGLVSDLTDRVCYTYTRAFLQYLEGRRELSDSREVALGGDLRPSTGRILRAVERAVRDHGCRPVRCGAVPSPALALYGIRHRVPAVMVTGSHIPADRNGIKFNKPEGEILKADEAGIREQVVDLDETRFGADGMFSSSDSETGAIASDARDEYLRRYLDFFPTGCLKGKRFGLYQHSAVGRDLLSEILQGLGAEVVPLGRSEEFVPVDTEAIRPEDVELARRWAQGLSLDGILSTDGDSDRPLLADENGEWLRGDVLGILCARFLGADSVSIPVSCNTAVERCGWFREVRRTRIGSPYVIESMTAASREGAGVVVGYEANGGFLTNTPVRRGGRTLRPLPTRDAVLPLSAVLLSAVEQGLTLSHLRAALPRRFTASDRLRNVPPSRSRAILDRFPEQDPERGLAEAHRMFGELSGRPEAIDHTDGVRVTFADGEVIHLRPSGNAPEFRCYSEAASTQRAVDLSAAALHILDRLRDPK